MRNYVNIDKLTLLKMLRDAYKALEEIEPHFTQRQEISDIEKAIEELTP